MRVHVIALGLGLLTLYAPILAIGALLPFAAYAPFRPGAMERWLLRRHTLG